MWDGGRGRAAAWLVPALNLAALLLFFSLDVRDLYFKAVWLGPCEAFGFQAVGSATYTTTPLAASAQLNLSSLRVGDDVEFASGWPSLLAKCDALYAPTDGFVLSVRASQCLLGFAAKPTQAGDLFLAASVRVDSVAWTACKLLYLHRRPPVCQENVVAEFFHRYRLSDPVVAADAMAEPNSDAEHELLQMLDLLSRSYPLSNVVCVEGVQYGGPGEYPAPTLVGCASPNVFDAAFVGLHAPAVVALHRDLAYLTVDVFNLMGFEFVVRQNSKSAFHVSPSDDDGRVTLTHDTHVNFSSFGHFYILVIAVDLALLAAHTRSALETATVLLLPLLGTPSAEDTARLAHEYSWTILYRSLYRSPPIVVLTLLSGLLSWQFQMPNSVIWTWSETSAGKIHALLTSVRVWMVVHCLLNQLWGVAVLLGETRAYYVAKRTFLSTFEVLCIGIAVAVADHKRTFAVSSAKYAAEGQRLWDAESFPGATGFSNSFNEELDYLLCTPAAVLGIVYAPMVYLVCEALLAAAVCLGLKFVYFSVRRRRGALIDNENEDAGESAAADYKLLPLEELLRVPVRAHSLVRSVFALELAAQQQLYIPPSIYFDFGVILDNDIIRTRRGFFNVIHLKVDVAKYFSPVSSSSAASVASMPSAVATTAGMQRPSSFFGVAATTSPSGSTRPPSSVASPLMHRSDSSKAIQDAVLATDLSPSQGSKGEDDSKGRQPLAETAGSPASRSMRRRKSTTELPSLADGF